MAFSPKDSFGTPDQIDNRISPHVQSKLKRTFIPSLDNFANSDLSFEWSPTTQDEQSVKIKDNCRDTDRSLLESNVVPFSKVPT